MVEGRRSLTPRRKPFRPVTKTLTFEHIKFDPRRDVWLVLARDPWQYYQIEVPAFAFEDQ